jgi:hypothetical protein
MLLPSGHCKKEVAALPSHNPTLEISIDQTMWAAHGRWQCLVGARVDCPAYTSMATRMPTEAPLASRVPIRRKRLELHAQRARVISASR